ncbi:PEP-CTERM sorting domain-containing protein [Akkermansiaceae bacterium]|nr:PEP-CTERM sorting domain-containing protein [Akkermansiaceae bacterium]
MKPLRHLSTPVFFSLLLTAHTLPGAIVLADAFADVGDAQKTGNTATFGSWDTVNGIIAPAASLSFFDADDGTTAVGFHSATDGELDVNQNMTAGGWVTSFALVLDGSTSSIDLTSIVFDMRLANGSGGNNTTGSKQGQMAFRLVGSSSGTLGTIDLGGDQGYPSVEYQRTLDLSSLPSLGTSETYTAFISATGSGFGHHKSLQAFVLNGDIAAVPEPSATLLLSLTALGLLRRKR